MLTIGIDFDNTLVDYDDVFYHVACEKKLIPIGFQKNKLSIRDYLRKIGKEEDWIKMQGIVYGSRMHEAKLYSGVSEFILEMNKKGHKLFVISHKTRHPFIGEKFDLHKAASDWSNTHLMIPKEHIFFELTKKEKIERIKQCQCDFFIDDLLEIFEDIDFPVGVKKILYGENACFVNMKLFDIVNCKSWHEVLICLNQ